MNSGASPEPIGPAVSSYSPVSRETHSPQRVQTFPQFEVGFLEAYSPQQPQTSRPQSVRGQSRRYLQQTLTKLSEDSLRIGRRLQGEAAWTPSPLPPLRQAYARPEQRDPWEVPRNMAAELHGKPPVDLPDLSAFAEEDARDHEGRGCANLEAGPPAEPEAELLAEGNPSMPMALLAVAKVINAWEAEVRTAADVWRVGLHEQVSLKEQADERWATLQEQLQSLQDRIEQLDTDVRSQKTWTAQSQEKMQTRIEDSLHQVAGEHCQQLSSAVATLSRSVDDHAESLKVHIDSLLAGTFDSFVETTDGQKSIGQQIKWMSDQLLGLSKTEDFLRATADKWQRSCEEAQGEIRRAQGESQEARNEAQRVSTSMAALQEQLQKAQQALERAQHAPGGDTLRQLKALEERGNVRIDRQTGRMELTKPLDFVPCSPADLGQPTVEFADAGIAAEIIADLSEIAGMFKVPMQVDLQLIPGKGGKPDFWESLAGAQARFVGDQLGKNGVPQNLLSIHGAVAPKGSKTGSVTLQLSQEIFPVPQPQGKLASKSPSGVSKSPLRK